MENDKSVMTKKKNKRGRRTRQDTRSKSKMIRIRIRVRGTRPDTRPPVADGWAGADRRVFPLFDSC